MFGNPLTITKRDIRANYDTTTYIRGLNYYKEGRVKSIEYKSQSWIVEVKGSSLYQVSIELTDEDFFTTCCDCPAHSRFAECKHEIAALIAISELETGNLFDNKRSFNQLSEKRKYQNADRLINILGHQDYLTSTIQAKHNKQPTKVEFIINQKRTIAQAHDRLLSIEMKIGTNRTYVVKKIKECLQNLEANKPISFTVNYSYEPLEHYIKQEDQEVITILQNIAKTEILNHQISNHWSPLPDNKELIIPSMVVEDLLNKLNNTDFETNFLPSSQSIEILSSDKLPISYTLIQGKNQDYELALSELEKAKLFKQYSMLLYQDKFYKLSPNQLNIIVDLITFYNQAGNSNIPIAKEQLELILAQVQPNLKRVGQLNIAESISDQIISLPLAAKIYLDFSHDHLLLKIEYHYGDRVINPIQYEKRTDDNSTILIRDVEKEQEIMRIIESTTFKYNGKEMYMEEEAEIYSFIFETIPFLGDKAEVFMTNSAKSLIISEQHRPKIAIDMDSSENWLEFSFSMEGINQEDIHNLLLAVTEKKRYYRLQSGAFVSIEDDDFVSINQVISELNLNKTELENGKAQRPVYRGVQIEEIAKADNSNTFKLSKTFKKFMQNLQNPEQLDFQLPTTINATLRDYQIFGFQWLKTLSHYGLGGILADDMGLGKTIQAIAYIASEIEQKKITEPYLIITPAALTYNWKNELSKFAPELNVKVLDGTPEERQQAIKELDNGQVWITSYPLLRQDSEHHQSNNYTGLILDEAQAIKNPATKIFKAVIQLRANKRFALSGTPIENSIDELWSIFQVVNPGFFPNKNIFRGYSHEKIAKLVRPFILRRIKKDVLKELPDKIETEQISELTKQQKELYLVYLERIRNESQASIMQEGFNKSRIKILAGLTRLRQICNHPSLFVDNYDGGSGKLEHLMELVTNSLTNSNRILIFSQFSSMLQIIKARLQEQEINCFYLDGHTPGFERVEMANRFNNGEMEVFLVSLKAGGTGLNLTGADTVILYDLWWNPAVEEQAAGRAHRIGQKKVVQVIRLITYGTIEEKIFELQQRKKELIAKILQPEEAMLNSLSEDDLREILNI